MYFLTVVYKVDVEAYTVVATVHFTLGQNVGLKTWLHHCIVFWAIH